MLERLRGEPTTLFQRHAVAGQHLADALVVVRVHDDHDIREILGGSADHGGAADVDVFQCVFQGDAGPGDGLPERVQISDHDVDRLDVVFFELRYMVRIRPACEQSSVDHRVQGFDTAVQYLRGTRHLCDLLDRQSSAVQHRMGPAGRHKIVPGGLDHTGEFDQS